MSGKIEQVNSTYHKAILPQETHYILYYIIYLFTLPPPPPPLCPRYTTGGPLKQVRTEKTTLSNKLNTPTERAMAKGRPCTNIIYRKTGRKFCSVKLGYLRFKQRKWNGRSCCQRKLIPDWNNPLEIKIVMWFSFIPRNNKDQKKV